MRVRRWWMAAGIVSVMAAEDWPQFRGPGGQGHSSEGQAPVAWSETDNIAWKAPVPGRGWSSPVVVKNRVWLTTATEEGRSLRLVAYEARTGKIVHDLDLFHPTDLRMHQKNSHASPTPVVSGDRVYVHFGAHGTAAVSASGEVLWKTRFDYYHRHGTGNSPVLAGDLLFINCDGYDQQFVVALDARTGREQWRKARKSHQAYATPLVTRFGGRELIISPGAHRAIAYDPRTGEEVWHVRYGQGYSNVPRPVVGGGLVFLCTGFDQAELLAVRPGGAGDVTETHVAWRLKRGVPLTPSPIVYGPHLYIVSDNGILSCLRLEDGQTVWRQRLGGNFSASPIAAAGRLYFTSEDGTTTVIAPGPAYQEAARNQIGEPVFASLAVSGGAFYLRTGSHLYRIGGSTH